jgi:hypothetical protein
MTLDDIVNGVSILEGLKNAGKPNNAHNDIRTLHNALAFVKDEKYIQNPELYNSLRTDDVERGVVNEAVTPQVLGLVGDSVKEDYGSLLESFSKEELIVMGIKYSPEAKNLRDYLGAIESKDVETIRGSLSSDEPGDIYTSVMMWATPEEVLAAGDIWSRKLQGEYIQENFSSEKKVKGKGPARVYDDKTALSYVQGVFSDENVLGKATLDLATTYASKKGKTVRFPERQQLALAA